MNLIEYASNFRSQNGEDGIIQKIFDLIGEPRNKYFVEFGAWDGEYLSNTYNLLKNQSWGGCYIEGDEKKFKDLQHKYADNKSIDCVHAFVESGNNKNCLTQILKRVNTPKDFALLSIDIDGNDYEVWRDLNDFEPLVVIIEYNQTIPPSVEFIDNGGKSFMGSSCLALFNLAKEKGYELICCTSTNCFFVKKELYHLFNVEDNHPSKLQNLDKQCFVALNHAGELVFSNKNFFQNDIRMIVYKRINKAIKHLLLGKKSFFFLGDKY